MKMRDSTTGSRWLKGPSSAERRRLKGDPKVRLAEALHTRALRLTSRGEYAEAEAVFRRAISLAQGCSGTSPLSLAVILNDTGVLSKYAGRFKRAARLYERAVALLPSGPDSREFRAALYHNLAGLEHARGRYARAIGYARQGLRLRRSVRPIDSAAVAGDDAALAAILTDLGRLNEAEQIQRRVLQAHRRRFGERHYETAASLANLSALLAKSGKFLTAERTLRRALVVLEGVLGRSHPRLASVLNNLATVCSRRGKFAEAEALYERVLRLLRRQAGPTYPSISLVRTNLKKLRRRIALSTRNGLPSELGGRAHARES